MAVSGALGGWVLTWAAIGILAGAMGKSAQFPLHVWLPTQWKADTRQRANSCSDHGSGRCVLSCPDVSAFRTFSNSLDNSGYCRSFNRNLRGFDRAGTNDIKRVLAYSTISQLG